eukprot:CAMPEP_0117532900 /NCGR_PEP_ID=MMETSP0784-20121206/39608_1 /TAXON_ID=39447 /ORGANISM="" /LENGTH=80 /DNA_ID=CAMNT_0005329311 /DNA_START=242 /DNA_END=479 /DNA_ORIENTATION=+
MSTDSSERVVFVPSGPAAEDAGHRPDVAAVVATETPLLPVHLDARMESPCAKATRKVVEGHDRVRPTNVVHVQRHSRGYR